jgi:A/G-specific adenine glycosylase
VRGIFRENAGFRKPVTLQLDRESRFDGNGEPIRMAPDQLKSKNSKFKIGRLAPALLGWFAANARDLPWRRTTDPYAIWVSEIMLQQTQVKTVLGYWERWMRALPLVNALAKAKPATIHKLWEGLGYYTRVRNMQKAAQEIMARHGGKFPRDYDAILELPGIGRYTAGAIASIAFNEPRAILDGNVMRVLARIFGIEGNAREKPANEELWKLAGELVVEANCGSVKSLNGYKVKTGSASRSGRILGHNGANCCSHLNQALMELGALICTPTQPKCSICPARKCCEALRTGRIEALPNLGKRAATTPRRFVAFVVQHRGRYLVRQRPAGVVNGHLWEFPNVEASGEHFNVKTIAKAELGHMPGKFEKLMTIKHTITRYRITLEAYRGEMKQPFEKTLRDGRWLTLDELRKLAFTSAHRRILEKISNI